MATGRALHIDIPLSNVAVEAFDSSGDYVAGNVFPPVSVDKQSNTYYTLDSASWLLVPDTYRAPKTVANKVEFSVSSDTYFARNYALGSDITLEDMANADKAVMLRQRSVNLSIEGLKRSYEVRTAAKMIANVSSVARLTSADAWDAVNSADIVGQVTNARIYLQGLTGLRPNAAVIDWRSLQYARTNALARDYTKYVVKGKLGIDTLMELWEIDNLYVARSMKNNSPESATASLTSIWGPTFALFVEGPATMQTQAYGLGFRWKPEGASTDFQVERQVFSGAGTKKVETVEASYFQDEKVLSSNLGYYINTKSGQVW